MRERKADQLGLHVIHLAHVTILVEQAHHVRVAHLDAHNLPLHPWLGRNLHRRGRNPHVKPLNLRCDLGKFGHRKFIAIGQNHGAEHGVFQLAHIARPVIARQQRGGLGAQASDFLAFFRSKAGRKAAGEIRHIIAARAQRRDGDRKHIEAIVQVFAEAAGLDQLNQVLVRC